MTRRAKRLRRLILLSAAIASVGAAAAAVTRQRLARHDAAMSALREAGLSAYAAGDFATTISKLDRYAIEHDDDAAALLPLAIARSKVPANDDGHYRAAIRTLTRVMELQPNNADARRTLLSLLIQTGDTDWMDRLAGDALAADAKDLVALQARLAARLRQSRESDALTAALALADAQPDDLDTRVLIVRLMARLDRTSDATAFASNAFTATDARRRLLVALADVAANRRDAALAGLRPLADVSTKDIVFIRHVMGGFDTLGQFDESLTLLDAAARRTGDMGLLRMLAMRLWQRGDTAALAALDVNDTTVLGLRAAALHRLGRDAEARATMNRLSARTDSSAMAWAVALPAVFSTPAGAPSALLQAVAKDPTNAVLRTWLADRYVVTGETALALIHFSAAAALEPGWAAPHAGRAAALVTLGRPNEAVDAARAAYDRKPGVPAAINLILTRFAALGGSNDLAKARELLAAIDSVQAVRPGEPQTLAIRATLLTRLGRPVQSAPPGTPAALAALARESGDPARLAEALAAADLSLAERPSDIDARFLQAGLLAQLGRRAAAEAALRVVLDARPDFAPAANDLACLLLDRKADGPEPEAIRADLLRVDLLEAEQLARRATAAAPMAAAFHDTLARVLARTGRLVEARRSFETAIQLDPTLSAARNGLSQLENQRAMTE